MKQMLDCFDGILDAGVDVYLCSFSFTCQLHHCGDESDLKGVF